MLVEADNVRGALRLTLNRPEKRNALNPAAIEQLRAHLHAYRDDSEIKFVLLTGAGDEAFCSGGDLNELNAVRSPSAIIPIMDAYRHVFDELRTFPVPTIAALNGDALGGGAELALACDMRIAAEHARIGFVHAKLALSTAWGGGADLLRMVGTSTALRLLASAEILSSHGAMQLRLIDAVSPADQPFDAFVDDWCGPFRGRTSVVMRAFKALTVAHRLAKDPHQIAQIEATHFLTTYLHEDHWSAIEAHLNPSARS